MKGFRPEIAAKKIAHTAGGPASVPLPPETSSAVWAFHFRQATCKVGRDMNEPSTQIDPTIGHAGDDLRADALMPAQFYPARRGTASIEPIMRLMGGILADAVRTFQRNFEAKSPSRRQEFREARFWIFHDKAEGPFSFEDVCDALGIDPRRLRSLILSWEKNKRPGDKPRMIRRSAVQVGGPVQARRRKG